MVSLINPAPATVYQVGTQSVLNTPVAATARLVLPGMQFEETDNVNRPQIANGLLLRSPGFEFVQARGSIWRAPAHPANFEQINGWLNTVLQGGVTGVSGNGAPYTWTHRRNPAVIPQINVLTLERRMTNFSDHIDERYPAAATTRYTLSGQRNGEIQEAVEGFARRRQTNTLTAAITMPQVEHIPYALSRVYLNNDWASLGTTQVEQRVLSWSWSFMTGAVGIPTADGNANLDYDVLVIDGRSVGIEFRARLMQSKARYDAEVAASEAQALRAVRIDIAGSSDRQITIDSLLKYEAGSITRVEEEDGQVVYDLVMREATDGAEVARVVVVNNINDQWGMAA